MSEAKRRDSVELEDLDLAAVAGLPACSTGEAQADAYARWVDKHALSESDAQYMAERMMLQWRARPNFHVLVLVTRGEEEALADTIDSLANQLYKEWGLSILSSEAPPPGWQQLPHIEWLKVEISTLDVANEVLRQSGAEWLVLLEVGIRLAPDAMFAWADYLNLHPGWRLIYSDEDAIDLAVNRCNPRFKPDFNLDLLRSMHYMGDVLAVEAKALRELSGYGGGEGAVHYGLALAIHDCFGAAAIGHIPKVLFHRQARFTRRRDAREVSRNQQEMLRLHLLRLGIDAVVSPGLIPETFLVEYALRGSPRVSVVVVQRQSGSRIVECVEGIIERTAYPNYEIVVAASGAPIDLPEDSRVRTVVIRDGSFAERCNAAATVAEGEYLVFIGNEGLVGHDDWLGRLIANGQRRGVGIVGGRVVDAGQRVVHSGYVLGLNGTVGSPDQGLKVDEPGYLDRLQVAQGMSAVSIACLLVRRDLYETLGGMRSKDFPEIFPDVDLCLRAANIGQETVWTPFVSMIGEPRRIGVDADAAAAERQALYALWLADLGADRAYNPNLTLTGPTVGTETEVEAAWEAPFRPRPRVMAFPLDAQGTGHYRVWGPLAALDRAVLAQYSLLPIHGMQARQLRVPSLPELARAAPDTLLIQHGYYDLFLDWIERYRDHAGAFIVFGQDDNLLDVPEKNSLKASLISGLDRRLARALGCCDRLIVTTEPLVDVYRRFIDDIHVVPNNLDGTRWRGLASLRQAGRKPRVGWAGAQQHLGDLDWLEPVIRRLSREVEWVFMGMCPENLKPFVAEFHEPVPFDDYPAKLATLDLDLAIAPLEIHPFNEGKSDLRLLEYGALGWPVIASDIYPYQGKPVTCLRNDPGVWVQAIRERVNDLDALAAEGDRLRDWVLAHRMLENNLDGWMRALFSEEVLRDYGMLRAKAA